MNEIPETAVEAAKRAVIDHFHGPDDKHATWWINRDEMAAAVLAAAAPEIERAAEIRILTQRAEYWDRRTETEDTITARSIARVLASDYRTLAKACE